MAQGNLTQPPGLKGPPLPALGSGGIVGTARNKGGPGPQTRSCQISRAREWLVLSPPGGHFYSLLFLQNSGPRTSSRRTGLSGQGASIQLCIQELSRVFRKLQGPTGPGPGVLEEAPPGSSLRIGYSLCQAWVQTLQLLGLQGSFVWPSTLGIDSLICKIRKKMPTW